jgi:hypothetical protein
MKAKDVKFWRFNFMRPQDAARPNPNSGGPGSRRSKKKL